MMESMGLLSSIFRSKEKEEKCIENPKGFQGGESCSETSRRFQEVEEDACTSCRGSREKGDHLEHEILSGYLAGYKCQPRSFKETLYFPQFIQLIEERRPCIKEEIKGNIFLLSKFDGSTIERAWARKLEPFFLLHPVEEREATEVAALHLEGEPMLGGSVSQASQAIQE